MKAENKRKVSLCLSCRHVKVIENANRSRFYLCLLSTSDLTFEKYPRFPVLACRGYQPQPNTFEDELALECL